MFSRIAHRLQELFNFGCESKARKRPSDSSNTSPVKRAKLSETSDMENNKDEDTTLRRPAMSRSIERLSTNSVVGNINYSHTNYISDDKNDGKLNGYDFSKIQGDISPGASFSFQRKSSNTSSRDRCNHLRRPSLVDNNWVNERSTNRNPVTFNNVTAVSPSIFKSWTGFKSSTPLPTSSSSPHEDPQNRKSNLGAQNTKGHHKDSYLHKRVTHNKYFDIKQCFQMDEKRKYRETLSRYVSPMTLSSINLTSEPRNCHGDVITISDSESNQPKDDLPTSSKRSPIVIDNDDEGRNNARPLTFAGIASRSLGPCSSTSLRNIEAVQPWRKLERKIEQATCLLEEVTRSSPNQSQQASQIDLTRLPCGVVASKDDRSPFSQGSCSGQWRTLTRSFNDQSKASSSRIETIAIEDSEDESDAFKDYSDEKKSLNENYARPGLRPSNDFEASAKSSPFVKIDYLKNLLDKTEESLRNVRVREVEAELEELRRQREEREARCNEKITNLIKLTRRLPVPIEEKYIELEDDDYYDDVIVEEAPRDDWPELTNEQEEQVNKAFKCRHSDQVLADGFKLQITARDVATLQGTNWLNDEVINFYFNMIVDRSQRDTKLRPVYAFNTFFYPKVISGGQKVVRRWTKNVDVFKYAYIILPVHLGVHWCLAVVDFPRKEIRYYDSMGGNNNACLDALLQYLVDEMQDKKQQVFDTNGWKKINVKGIPQQMNGSDCGMFSCKFADYITKDAKITFNQSHMPYFRRRMVYEILTKKLM